MENLDCLFTITCRSNREMHTENEARKGEWGGGGSKMGFAKASNISLLTFHKSGGGGGGGGGKSLLKCSQVIIAKYIYKII